MVPHSILSIVFYCTNNLPYDLKRFAGVHLSTDYHYNIAVWGALIAIKFKAVLIALAVLFGAGIYYKMFPGHGYYRGSKCPPPEYDSHHYEHGPPYGHSDRSDRATDLTEYTDKMDFELLATVMKG
jgi:hypothetical protein